MSKFCQYCGNAVEENAKFCTNCGSNLEDAPAQQPVQQPVSETSAPVAQPVQATYEQPAATGSVPGWKTSVALSIVGIIASMCFNSAVNALGNDNSAFGGVLSLVYIIAAIIYALVFYPKYFDGRRVENSGLTSFLNCFFGGIIFGLIWNSNLTKNHKGISHIVFVVLVPCLFILIFAIAFLGVFLGSMA